MVCHVPTVLKSEGEEVQSGDSLRQSLANRLKRFTQAELHSTTQRLGNRNKATFGFFELDDTQRDAMFFGLLSRVFSRVFLIDVPLIYKGDLHALSQRLLQLLTQGFDLHTVTFVG